MERIFYTILAILVLLIGIAFAVLNRQAVELNYYFGLKLSGPQSMALLAAFAFGVVAGYIAGLRTVVRMQRQLVQARKEIRHARFDRIHLDAEEATFDFTVIQKIGGHSQRHIDRNGQANAGKHAAAGFDGCIDADDPTCRVH